MCKRFCVGLQWLGLSPTLHILVSLPQRVTRSLAGQSLHWHLRCRSGSHRSTGLHSFLSFGACSFVLTERTGSRFGSRLREAARRTILLTLCGQLLSYAARKKLSISR